MTMRQLLLSPRKHKRKRKKSPGLRGNPQKFISCVKVFTRSPKKPNSAVRKLAKVELLFKLKNIQSYEERKDPRKKYYTNAYLPGENHNFQKGKNALICGGRTPDLPGIKYKVIRGTFDFKGVEGRITSRSQYGTKQVESKSAK